MFTDPDWILTNQSVTGAKHLKRWGETVTEAARHAFMLPEWICLQCFHGCSFETQWNKLDVLLESQIQPPCSLSMPHHSKSWKHMAVWISKGPWSCRLQTILPGSLTQVDSYSKHIFSLITFHVCTVNSNAAVDLCWVLADTWIYYTKGYGLLCLNVPLLSLALEHSLTWALHC